MEQVRRFKVLLLLLVGALILYPALFVGHSEWGGHVVRVPDSVYKAEKMTGGRLAPGESPAGHVSVINVWASWCAPCRKEAPILKALAREHSKHDVRFLGINSRDNVRSAREFQRKADPGYPSLVDESGKLARQLGVTALPTTLVVDEKGNILARIVGAASKEEIAEAISKRKHH